MEVRLKIRKLLSDLKLTQANLGLSLGLHPSTIGLYLAGQRTPDSLTCLLFAGICKDPEDRRFFLAQTGLSGDQLRLIAHALGAASAGTTPATYRSDTRPSHDDLEFILTTEESHRAEWLKGNIQTFAEALRSRPSTEGKRKRGA